MTPGMIAVIVIACYLSLLLGLGLFSSRFFKGTASDFFLASRGIGPFLLLMSLFGTTMTGFALVGSSGESFKAGIGVYGMMASSSGIIHSACFFLVGIKLWSLGKKHGYTTQIQYFRDRFDSDKIGLILFPILVGLIIPYLLVGIISGGIGIQAVTQGAFPDVFPNDDARIAGGIPFWLGSGVICLVVMIYVFFGGVRGTAWANAFQTIVFIILGAVAFTVIADKLGGPSAASQQVAEFNPTKLKRDVNDSDLTNYQEKLAAWEQGAPMATIKPAEPKRLGKLHFISYLFIPLSVGMFPHLFQHWLTAKSANSFKLAVIAHPILIMVVWVPCVLIGVWATSAMVGGSAVVPPDFPKPNAVLVMMVRKIAPPVLGGLITAGVLAAIMSSLDSQFLCLGSIFTNDIANHYISRDKLTDHQKVALGRVFVVFVVAVSYLLSLALRNVPVFSLGIWCFTGFASLFPLVFAAVYWRGATKAGAYACVIAVGVTWFYFFAQSGYGANREYLFLDMMPVATIIAASTAALVIVSLMTRPPSAATLEKFFDPR